MIFEVKILEAVEKVNRVWFHLGTRERPLQLMMLNKLTDKSQSL